MDGFLKDNFGLLLRRILYSNKNMIILTMEHFTVRGAVKQLLKILEEIISTNKSTSLQIQKVETTI